MKSAFEDTSSDEIRFEDAFQVQAASAMHDNGGNDNDAAMFRWDWNDDDGIDRQYEAFKLRWGPPKYNAHSNVRKDDNVRLDHVWNHGVSAVSNKVAVIEAADFVKSMMETISHPINGDMYKDIVRKYDDKEKYSFLVMKSLDGLCFDGTDEFTVDPKAKTFQTNVVIVENIRGLFNAESEKDECFPIILRFKEKRAGFTVTSQQQRNMTTMGYPMKVWICKKTTVKNILEQFIHDTKDTKFEFDSCSVNNNSNLLRANDSFEQCIEENGAEATMNVTVTVTKQWNLSFNEITWDHDWGATAFRFD
mmetsp:Transcript_49117/g.78461  ORF Transcript_49117/g.78461 Transcript_49117/m.78461 type:complete len:306 (-) Transcript_49117:57-974(-)